MRLSTGPTYCLPPSSQSLCCHSGSTVTTRLLHAVVTLWPHPEHRNGLLNYMYANSGWTSHKASGDRSYLWERLQEANKVVSSSAVPPLTAPTKSWNTQRYWLCMIPPWVAVAATDKGNCLPFLSTPIQWDFLYPSHYFYLLSVLLRNTSVCTQRSIVLLTETYVTRTFLLMLADPSHVTPFVITV
jgi:hypothetical protein